MSGARLKRTTALIAASVGAAGFGACGLNVSSADLFLLTRSGQGTTLRLLVSDGGTIRCNGGASKPLSDSMLLTARNLVTVLTKDAQRNLRLPARSGSVFRYTVKLSAGTVTFGDNAAAGRSELAQTELFALQAVRGPCGLSST